MKKMVRMLAAGMLMGMFGQGLSIAHAQTITVTPELAKIIAGAKAEGHLTISYPAAALGGGPGAEAAMAGLNKMFGTSLDVVWAPGPFYAAEGAKLLGELQAKQPASSGVFVGTAIQFDPLIQAGLFQSVDWAGLMPDRIKPEFSEAGGQALRIYTNLPAILYNKRYEKQVKQVTSLNDFLKPEWKGKFYTTPIMGGFDVVLSDQNWGEKKTTDFIRLFAKQAAGAVDCGTPDRIASGEIPVLVMDCSGSLQNVVRYRPAIDAYILQDFAQKRYGYLGVPKNAPSPNASILFTLFWMSPEGQQLIYKTNGTDLVDFPDSEQRTRIDKLHLNFTEVTIDWWHKQTGLSAAQDRLIKVLASEMK